MLSTTGQARNCLFFQRKTRRLGPNPRFDTRRLSPLRREISSAKLSSRRRCRYAGALVSDLLDGEVWTFIAVNSDFRRRVDTFLSPKCCKAQDMAVCAPCDGPRLWNSGSTARRPDAAALFPKIPTVWKNDGFRWALCERLLTSTSWPMSADLRCLGKDWILVLLVFGVVDRKGHLLTAPSGLAHAWIAGRRLGSAVGKLGISVRNELYSLIICQPVACE